MPRDPETKGRATITVTVTADLSYDAALSVLGKCIKPGKTVEISADDFHIEGTVTAEITSFPAGICPECHTDCRDTTEETCPSCGEEIPR